MIGKLKIKYIAILMSIIFYSGQIHANPAVAVDIIVGSLVGLVVGAELEEELAELGILSMDDSWIHPIKEWVKHKAGLLEIEGEPYLIPLKPDWPIPRNTVVDDSDTDDNGIYPYDAATQDYTLSENCCFVLAEDSIDGARHNLPNQEFYDYDAWVIAADEFFKEFSKNYRLHFPDWGWFISTDQFGDYPNEPLAPLAMDAQGDSYKNGAGITLWNFYPIWVKHTQFYFNDGVGGNPQKLVGGYIWPSPGRLHESKDNRKRFLREEAGFLPDKSDPDWTKAEIDSFPEEPFDLKFTNPEGDKLFVSSGKIRTKILSVVKLSEEEVKLRGLLLDSYADIYSISEEVLKSPSIEQAVEEFAPSRLAEASESSTGTETGTGGETTPIELPDDYARRGEAGAAADKVVEALSDSSIDDITRPGKDKDLPNFDDRKDDINDLPGNDFGLDWTDFLPSLFPGEAVECHSIELEGTIDAGPARGLSSKAYLDVCWVLEFIRTVLGWFFGVLTLIYIFRSLTNSQSPEK
jgi:hypothetical protein